MQAPRQWQTIPKFLNAAEIDRLLDAPDASEPTGLRDRAMLQLLYATGLRVSELCRTGMSDLNLEMGVLRTMGKGNKQRLIPVGREAIQAVEAYLANGRPALLKGRASRYLFVTARGGCLTRQAFWKLLARPWQEGGDFPRPDAARAAAQLRHPFAGAWRRFAQRADHVGTRRHLDHADLYPCHAVEIAGHDPGASPPGLRVRKRWSRGNATMSDYIYILENHLSADQSQVVHEVQAAAGEANVNLFLTGGAMRDMLAGFPHPRSGFRGGRARAEAGQSGERQDRGENRLLRR